MPFSPGNDALETPSQTKLSSIKIKVWGKRMRKAIHESGIDHIQESWHLEASLNVWSLAVNAAMTMASPAENGLCLPECMDLFNHLNWRLFAGILSSPCLPALRLIQVSGWPVVGFTLC